MSSGIRTTIFLAFVLDRIFRERQNAFRSRLSDENSGNQGMEAVSGSVLGAFRVKYRLHYSWIAVLPAMALAVVTQFSTGYPMLERVTLGIVASLVFLFICLLRGIILTAVNSKKGVKVRRNLIFATGNVLDVDEKTLVPAVELLTGVIGLLFDLFVAGLLFIVYLVSEHTGSIMVHVFVQWLAFLCFMLALFNFLPCLPLDGGRILRGLFWRATNNYYRTTRVLSWTGWIIGLGIVATGIFLTVDTRQWFVGVLLILPGLILQNSALHQRRLGINRREKQTEPEELVSLID